MSDESSDSGGRFGMFKSIPPRHRLPAFVFIVLETILLAAIRMADSQAVYITAIVLATLVVALFLWIFMFKGRGADKANDTYKRMESAPDAPHLNPYVEVQCERDPGDDVTVIVELYTRNATTGHWVSDRTIQMEYDGRGEFKLHTAEIASQLRERHFPYKLFCRVRENERLMSDYCFRLFSNGRSIITGKGVPDQDDGYWRIYFLVNDQPVHPEMRDLYEINHCLPQAR